MEGVNPRRLHIHWAWLPAAVFFVVVAWIRYGAVVTVIAVIGGLAAAAYAERRARRRRGETDAD